MKTAKQIIEESAMIRRSLYTQIILESIGGFFLGAISYALVVFAFCM